MPRVSAKINLAVDEHWQMINDILGILHDYIIPSPHIGITSCTLHTPAGLMAISICHGNIDGKMTIIRICKYLYLVS